MTEKDIMKRLTHTMIWHLFKPTFQGITETDLSSERTLFDRLGAYIIDKTGLTPIFEYLTSLTDLPNMTTHRTHFTDYVNFMINCINDQCIHRGVSSPWKISTCVTVIVYLTRSHMPNNA